jgi:Toprim domain-containing protein
MDRASYSRHDGIPYLPRPGDAAGVILAAGIAPMRRQLHARSAARAVARFATTARPAARALAVSSTLRRPDGTYGPAMVARVDGADGRLIGVHRTWFARDSSGAWRRRDRASLGPIGGGAVRLSMPREGEWLGIGEGIETTLPVVTACGMPGWAALSSADIRALILPAAATHVIICADHDASGVGQRAAHDAAARWLAEGRRVRIALPPEPGTDNGGRAYRCCYACGGAPSRVTMCARS